ncbi:hypothetical protein HDU86_000005 [Geranomyces michiganensis]|nr:hypothetical protein HDU86_000005 [Geranomyces michiganensis]
MSDIAKAISHGVQELKEELECYQQKGDPAKLCVPIVNDIGTAFFLTVHEGMFMAIDHRTYAGPGGTLRGWLVRTNDALQLVREHVGVYSHRPDSLQRQVSPDLNTDEAEARSRATPIAQLKRDEKKAFNKARLHARLVEARRQREAEAASEQEARLAAKDGEQRRALRLLSKALMEVAEHLKREERKASKKARRHARLVEARRKREAEAASEQEARLAAKDGEQRRALRLLSKALMALMEVAERLKREERKASKKARRHARLVEARRLREAEAASQEEARLAASKDQERADEEARLAAKAAAK